MSNNTKNKPLRVSTQFLSEDIDQVVLNALTTRAGGEIIDGNAAF